MDLFGSFEESHAKLRGFARQPQPAGSADFRPSARPEIERSARGAPVPVLPRARTPRLAQDRDVSRGISCARPRWAGRAKAAPAVAGAIAAGLMLGIPSGAFAQGRDDPRWRMNLDTTKIAAFSLPDPLVRLDGTRVTSAETWRSERRPELVDLLERTLFGRVPEGKVRVRVVERTRNAAAFGGRALRREIRIQLATDADSLSIDLLVYTPTDAIGPVPTFLGLNFFGNHTIGMDPEVQVAEGWVGNYAALGITGNRSNERARGSVSYRWPVEEIVSRGYGLATANYGDIDPDFHDGFHNGAHALFPEPRQVRAPDAWGSIAAWAWGLSRILDALESDSYVDAARVILIGHSRLGRTAVWAGARDSRFAMVIANNGLGGLFKRNFGATLWQTTTRHPHWFAGAVVPFAATTEELPVDNHLTLALIAPRPLYLGTASEDVWANPAAEFLAAKAAEPVWHLLGRSGLAMLERPASGQASIEGMIGFHVREGGHDLTAWDWARYLDFADRHLRRTQRQSPPLTSPKERLRSSTAHPE